MMPPLDHVDVYPVGVLADLRHAWLFLTCRRFPALGKTKPPWPWRIKNSRASLAHARMTIMRYVRARDWHNLRQAFNGYLAEPYHWPEGMTKCGRGWTKAAAMRSLRRRGWTL